MHEGMGGFSGMPRGTTFKMSGNMGDMNGAGIDPNEIFKMFFGGNLGGMGPRMKSGKSGNAQFFTSGNGGEDFDGF